MVSKTLNASRDDIETENNNRNFSAAVGFPVLIPVSKLPSLPQPMHPPSSLRKNPVPSRIIIILICTFGAFLSVIICNLIVFVYPKCYKKKTVGQTESKLKDIDLTRLKTVQDKLLLGVSDYLKRPIMYDTQTIMQATMNLSERYLIGGSVYRVLINGEYCAIKQTKGDVAEELKILQKVNHANLVKLNGVSTDKDLGSFLIYEFAENGSLDKWLFPKAASSSSSLMFLSWRQRLNIALDVAHGLQYMHEHTRPCVVHQDIRTSNILLSSQFKAKITNFSMAKPATDAIATKLDVYAFGIILLELLLGRKAMETREGRVVLMLWQDIRAILEFAEEKREERLKEWMDPNLEGFKPVEGALNLANMARACTLDKPSARPSMGEIVFGLSVLTQSS